MFASLQCETAQAEELWQNNCEKSNNSAVRPVRLSVRTNNSACNGTSFAKLCGGEYFV
jgi:hypothetical protein